MVPVVSFVNVRGGGFKKVLDVPVKLWYREGDLCFLFGEARSLLWGVGWMVDLWVVAQGW